MLLTKHRQAIVAAVGDMHFNSTIAATPPSFNLDAGGTHKADRVQRFIYDKWLEYWREIWEVKQRLGWPVYVIMNGELADSNYHATTQLISRNPADQLAMALKLLEPAYKIADHLIVIRGTAAHSGQSSWMDELLARDLGALPVRHRGEDDPRHAHWQWRGVIGGVRFDVAHHPGHGHMRPWTRGGDANRLAADIRMRYDRYNDYMMRQKEDSQIIPPPQIVLRGHNHKPSDSGHNFGSTRAIIAPSWQLGYDGDFSNRLGGDWLPNGGLYILCDNGEPTVRWRDWMMPLGGYWQGVDV